MFRKSSSATRHFNMSGHSKNKQEPIPVYQKQDTSSVQVIRSEIDPAFTMGLSKKYLRSSGLEK